MKRRPFPSPGCCPSAFMWEPMPPPAFPAEFRPLPKASRTGRTQQIWPGISASPQVLQYTSIYSPARFTVLIPGCAYVRGWTASIELHGYIPGVYSSADQLHLIPQQLWCSGHLLYWVTSGPSATASFPPPCPRTFLSFANLWQYVQQVPVCRTAGMDLDSTQNTAGMWTLV